MFRALREVCAALADLFGSLAWTHHHSRRFMYLRDNPMLSHLSASEIDALALRSDWYMVGRDMETAIRALQQEREEERC